MHGIGNHAFHRPWGDCVKISDLGRFRLADNIPVTFLNTITFQHQAELRFKFFESQFPRIGNVAANQQLKRLNGAVRPVFRAAPGYGGIGGPAGPPYPAHVITVAHGHVIDNHAGQQSMFPRQCPVCLIQRVQHLENSAVPFAHAQAVTFGDGVKTGQIHQLGKRQHAQLGAGNHVAGALHHACDEIKLFFRDMVTSAGNFVPDHFRQG